MLFWHIETIAFSGDNFLTVHGVRVATCYVVIIRSKCGHVDKLQLSVEQSDRKLKDDVASRSFLRSVTALFRC
jgi:hypothetical protein